MLTCSETCRTFSIPCIVPVFDLAPRSYHDSMPGSRALKPLRLSRFRCGSESSDRLLSSGKVQADGPMRGAVLQDVTDDGLVGEAQDVVEVLHGVLGVTAGVRAAEDGDPTV